jgi:hypothetical protein
MGLMPTVHWCMFRKGTISYLSHRLFSECQVSSVVYADVSSRLEVRPSTFHCIHCIFNKSSAGLQDNVLCLVA